MHKDSYSSNNVSKLIEIPLDLSKAPRANEIPHELYKDIQEVRSLKYEGF